MNQSEIIKLSVEDIQSKIAEFKAKLGQLRLAKTRTESKDTSVFQKTRRSIAQLFTELNKRKG